MKKTSGAKLFCFLLGSLICFAGCGGGNAERAVKPGRQAEPAALLVSEPGRDAAEPAVAAAADGTLYVAWVEHLPEKRADVFVRRFDGDRNPLGEAVRVNQENGAATAWRGDPPTVKVGTDGAVYVGWTTRVAVPEGSANDLYLSVSRDGGATFDAPVRVSDDGVPAARGMHSLEIDKTGRIFVAWLDERYLKSEPAKQPLSSAGGSSGGTKDEHSEPNSEVYFAFSSDGGKTFSANKKIAGNICPCCKTSMAIAPDGRLYVAWRQVLDGDFRHIAVSSSIDGGDGFAPATIVSDDQWRISGCPVSGAGMIVDPAGNLHVAWFTAGAAGAPGIYRAASADGGKTFSPRSLVSGDAAGGTPVILKDAAGFTRLAFSSGDKNALSFSAPNGSADFTAGAPLADADLPAAALSRDKMFVAFVRNESEKRGVYLVKQD